MTKRDLRKLLSYVLAIAMVVGTLFVGEVGKVNVKANSLNIDSITVAGGVKVGSENGSENWLEGWSENADENHMFETSEGVWEITYPCINAGIYQFKFTVNDSWSVNFGGTNGVGTVNSGLYYEATTDNGANYELNITSKSNITIRLDLREFNGTNGANMIVVVTEAETNGYMHGGAEKKGTITIESENVSYTGFPRTYIDGSWEVYANAYMDHSTSFYPLPGFVIDKNKFEFLYWDGSVWKDVDESYYMFNPEWAGTRYDFGIFAGDLANIPGDDVEFKVIVKAVEIDQYPMYVVAGSEALTGANWKGTWVENEDNIMLSEDGKYTKTYSYVQPGNYEFKVVRFDSLNGATWIGNNGGNVTFSVAVPCDVTITYDPSTNGISIKYNYITNLTVAGDGDWDVHGYNWLYEDYWREDSEYNHMEEVGTNSNIWQKVYYNVASGDFEFKIALNDSWDLSLGMNGEMENGVYYDAIRYNNDYASGKCTFSLAEDPETDYTDRYNVFIRVDVSNYDPIAGTGAKIMMASVKSEEYEYDGDGFFGEGPGDGVTYKVDNLIYSGIGGKKDYGYISTLYPLPEYKLPSSIKIYCEEDPTIVLEEGEHYTYDSTTGELFIKMFDREFYQASNWVRGSGTVIVAEAIPEYPLYLVAGDSALTGSHWNNAKDNNEANHMNKVGNEFVKTYTNVQRGNYSLKVVNYSDRNANPSWIGKDGGDGNVTFSVGTPCDITVKYDPVTNKITVEGIGIVDYLFDHMSIAGTTELFGSEWTPVEMTYSSETGKWEYTITDVAAGNYEYKYTADSAWTHSWGNDGEYDGSNYPLNVEYSGSTVVFRVDLTGVDMLNPNQVRLSNTEVEIIKPIYDVTYNLDSEITKVGNDAVTAGDEYSVTLSVEQGYKLPDAASDINITVGGSRLSEDKYTYNRATGVISIPSGVIVGDVVITVTAAKLYNVTGPTDVNLEFTGSNIAVENEEYTAVIEAKDGYLLPETIIITMNGEETSSYTYNSTNGSITISLGNMTVTGDFVIIANAVPKTYSVTEDIDSKLEFIGAATATHDVEYTAKLEAATGYELPDTITVKVNGVELVKGTDYTYDSTTGNIVITAAKVTGNIVISAESVAKTYSVTYTVDDKLTYTGDNTATQDVEYTANIEATTGYKLPEAITVKVNGVELVEGTDYTYDSTTGNIVIIAAKVTGNMEIVAESVEIPVVEPTEYDVLPPTDNNIEVSGELVATENEEYTVKLTAKTGYKLPREIIVKIAGVMCNEFIYNENTGEIIIPASCVSGDIEIMAVAEVEDDTENEGGDNTENEGGDNTENEGEDNTENEGGDNTENEGGDNTENEGGDNTENEGGDNTENESGDNTENEGEVDTDKKDEDNTDKENDDEASENNTSNGAGNNSNNQNSGSGNIGNQSGNQNGSVAKPGDSAPNMIYVLFAMAIVVVVYVRATSKKMKI